MGTSYFTDSKKQVILRIEWGTDWHIDEISFSQGAKEDLPDSIKSVKRFPECAVSSRIHANLCLDKGIKLGIKVQKLLQLLGQPKSDISTKEFRLIKYETDYRTTKEVLIYEASFYFKGNRLVRFKVYNGD